MGAKADYVKALKTQLPLARKRPLNFGLCLSDDLEATLLKLHRDKEPKILAAEARREGAGIRTVQGVVMSAGKTLTLVCEGKTPSGLAKTMVRWLRHLDINMQVDVREVDEINHNVVQALAKAEKQAIEAEATEKDDELRRKRIVAEMRRLQELARGAPDMREAMGELKRAAELLKQGEIDEAEAALPRIEALLTPV